MKQKGRKKVGKEENFFFFFFVEKIGTGARPVLEQKKNV